MNEPNRDTNQPHPRTIEGSSVETLLCQLTSDPDNWGLRKAAAVKLYESEMYLDAADILWNAPEMPATDMDVAFAIKVVSRARPNRSIRLIYEVIRRNVGKPLKNIAMARAMNLVGMPMQAARFYGAAVATGSEHFDLSFEKQSLWFDDSGSLLEAWEKSDQDAKPPLAVSLEYFTEDKIDFARLAEDVLAAELVPKVATSAQTAETVKNALSATSPHLAPAEAPKPTAMNPPKILITESDSDDKARSPLSPPASSMYGKPPIPALPPMKKKKP